MFPNQCCHLLVIIDGIYTQNYHEIISKLEHFSTVDVPNFKSFQKLKEEISKAYEKDLKIAEFEPKVLTSFVRNKLINEVYFPLIGNNLAKQLGTAGENKRTARMGMLLLISPPGYGKTTLMEYLAKTMGLHFVKVNGPTIGHNITSIDPIEAKTSGEREELKKINLSFEMADNVMLYLDDIQHLSAEFLQKFISLADGQRKIDGIFEGESKTYDLRGKRFCIVMAGNPYTESGSKFQIPDMLANRADVYNLGDVIGDTETLFNLSLIENHETTFAIIAVPCEQVMYIGYRSQLPYKYSFSKQEWFQYQVESHSLTTPVQIGLSHNSKNPKYKNFIEPILQHREVTRREAGSAYKFCMMLEGEIDIYPRFHPTSEWDTSSGQAFLESIGGGLMTLEGKPFQYNQRETVLNNGFIAFRDQDYKTIAYDALRLSGILD